MAEPIRRPPTNQHRTGFEATVCPSVAPFVLPLRPADLSHFRPIGQLPSSAGAKGAGKPRGNRRKHKAQHHQPCDEIHYYYRPKYHPCAQDKANSERDWHDKKRDKTHNRGVYQAMHNLIAVHPSIAQHNMHRADSTPEPKRPTYARGITHNLDICAEPVKANAFEPSHRLGTEVQLKRIP